MNKQTTIKRAILIIIAILILGTLAFHFGSAMLFKEKLPAPVVIDTTNQPMLGNPAATVHIVAFEDLKCVNCAHFSNTIFQTIQKKYIKTGIANYTMINLAFVPGSMPAANAARCVYQQNPVLFFQYIEAIFKNQPPEDDNWATVPMLLTFAGEIPGINSDALAACMIANPYQSFIENNLKMASILMNHTVATPTVYVNGIIVKPLTEKNLENVINAVKK